MLVSLQQRMSEQLVSWEEFAQVQDLVSSHVASNEPCSMHTHDFSAPMTLPKPPSPQQPVLDDALFASTPQRRRSNASITKRTAPQQEAHHRQMRLPFHARKPMPCQDFTNLFDMAQAKPRKAPPVKALDPLFGDVEDVDQDPTSVWR